MNCVVCDAELAKWEQPQAMTVGGQAFMPKALCTPCAHANLGRPGSREALDRLVAGKADPDAAEALRQATPSPWDTP